MSVILEARPGLVTFARWLGSDWKVATEDQAQRLTRPTWGVMAWLVYSVLMGVLFQRASVIGLPLVLLAFLRLRGPIPIWLPVIVCGLMAFLAAARWTNGAAEWTRGVGEFNLVCVLFAARCAWASWRLPAVRRVEAVEAFS